MDGSAPGSRDVRYGNRAQGDRIGVPVFDIVTLTEMVYRSLTRQPFGGHGACGVPKPCNGR